jgi:hypothetical protein
MDEDGRTISSAAFNREAFDRLKKIAEDAGLGSDMQKISDILSAIRINARPLVELALWRVEQSDAIGRRLTYNEVFFIGSVVESLLSEIRVATRDRHKEPSDGRF